MNRGTICALAVLAAAPLGFAADENPQPFHATYSVVFRGLNAGTSEFQLERQPNGQYLYSSRSNARGIYRMFLSDEIVQTSLLTLGADGVRPLRYRGDDGSEDTERDISLDFDWDRHRVTGVAEDKPVDIELPPQTQDAMSIQIAAIHDLQNGRKLTGYRIVDKDEVKEYQYTYEGTVRLKTVLGELETVVYSSRRAGSNKRVTRTWQAPSLGYVPVRAERLKDGKREWLMEIQALKR